MSGGDERLMRELQRSSTMRITASQHNIMSQYRSRTTGHEYALPNGRREIGPEVAAEAVWEAMQAPIEQALMPWLQVRGLCAESNGRRILSSGIEVKLRHAGDPLLASSIDVPSATASASRMGLRFLCVADRCKRR